jgi:PncC family amidohydrolase
MPECNEPIKMTIPGLTVMAEQTAERLIEQLKRTSYTIALAESCTAGLVSALLANTPGVSSVLWGSFVCYTQEAKVSMLGLDNGKLSANGLVSRETACSMAAGALEKSGAKLAASVTGLAGPGGDDNSTVPIGTVWIATALRDGGVSAREFRFAGTRNEIRLRAVIAVLEMMYQDILDIK